MVTREDTAIIGDLASSRRRPVHLHAGAWAAYAGLALALVYGFLFLRVNTALFAGWGLPVHVDFRRGVDPFDNLPISAVWNLVVVVVFCTLQVLVFFHPLRRLFGMTLGGPRHALWWTVGLVGLYAAWFPTVDGSGVTWSLSHMGFVARWLLAILRFLGWVLIARSVLRLARLSLAIGPESSTTAPSAAEVRLTFARARSQQACIGGVFIGALAVLWLTPEMSPSRSLLAIAVLATGIVLSQILARLRAVSFCDVRPQVADAAAVAAVSGRPLREERSDTVGYPAAGVTSHAVPRGGPVPLAFWSGAVTKSPLLIAGLVFVASAIAYTLHQDGGGGLLSRVGEVFAQRPSSEAEWKEFLAVVAIGSILLLAFLLLLRWWRQIRVARRFYRMGRTATGHVLERIPVRSRGRRGRVLFYRARVAFRHCSGEQQEAVFDRVGQIADTVTVLSLPSMPRRAGLYIPDIDSVTGRESGVFRQAKTRPLAVGTPVDPHAGDER